MPFDSKTPSTMRRVMIPVHTDRWMKGDKYGVIVKSRTVKRNRAGPDSAGTAFVMIYYVKLDKSGDVVRFIAEQCKLL